ncbi:MAG: hypothetical protein Q4G10_08955 [Bacteroidia bacterium]|nr:hypothetical protein [Bacteroidia bacterium]
MKKLILITVALLAAFAFTSCEKEEKKKDDPKTDYPYSYCEPCMIWGASKDEVKQYMQENFPKWTADEKSATNEYILYIDDRYKTINISYDFKNDKLESSFLAYPFRSDSFNKLKSDIESRYKVEMKWQGVYGSTELFYAHSDERNMDINLSNSDSDDLYHTISVDFTGTGPAPSDKIKFEVTPSNKTTLNYTDLTTIKIAFPEAKEVSLYDDFFKDESISLVSSEGSTIWTVGPSSRNISVQGNVITIGLTLGMYEKLTKEGDYTLVITPNTVLVDGRFLLEQRITYHLTAIPPVTQPFTLKFDDKLTNDEELHFYIPEGIEAVGWDFRGGTVIYDDENNASGKVYNFSQVEGRHFYLVMRMTATDVTKRYHFDLAEGLIIGRTAFGDLPSAAATVYFQL